MHTSEQAHESNFVKVFIGVLIALTLFTLFCIFTARALAPVADAATDEILRAALQERIAPVGSVNTSADQIDVQPAASAGAAASGPETVEQLVGRACAACHLSGAAGAPKSDDAAEWEKRREAGLDALVASVVNGKGAMPARAGSDLSDEQLMLAVKQLAGFDVPETDGDGAAESGASEETATGSATESSSAAATVAAGAGAVEISAKAKTAADSLCIGCHLAGVAGAPKIGDKEDWTKRAEKGMDEMVKTVVTGKGAMPPNGGSDLTEEELASAINYLMSK